MGLCITLFVPRQERDRQFICVLALDDGTTAFSTPLPTYDLADQVGSLSLLDAAVLSYTVEVKEAPRP